MQNARYAKLKYAEYTKEAKRTNCGNMQICNYMMNCLNMQNANIVIVSYIALSMPKQLTTILVILTSHFMQMK